MILDRNIVTEDGQTMFSGQFVATDITTQLDGGISIRRVDGLEAMLTQPINWLSEEQIQLRIDLENQALGMSTPHTEAIIG